MGKPFVNSPDELVLRGPISPTGSPWPSSGRAAWASNVGCRLPAVESRYDDERAGARIAVVILIGHSAPVRQAGRLDTLRAVLRDQPWNDEISVVLVAPGARVRSRDGRGWRRRPAPPGRPVAVGGRPNERARAVRVIAKPERRNRRPRPGRCARRPGPRSCARSDTGRGGQVAVAARSPAVDRGWRASRRACRSSS